MSAQALLIGQAAEACGITAKNIRYYEAIGLIPKAPRHNNAAHTGGNRLYRDDDLRRLLFIRNSRMLGLGLDEIAELLALSAGKGCPGAQPRYRSRLASHLETINERIDQLLGLRATLEGLLASADGGGLVGRCGCSAKGAHAPANSRTIAMVTLSDRVARRPRGGRAA